MVSLFSTETFFMNAYQLPTNTTENFLSEVIKIRRCEHPQFRGDGIYNADAKILEACRKQPEAMHNIFQELDFVDSEEFHPVRVSAIKHQIIDCLDLIKILNLK